MDTPADPILGTLLNGRYRLDAQLGHGGMGTVYRAHDTLLERDIAVKVLSSAGLGTEGRAHLLHEARAVAQLNHPNIVAIYDAGEANGTPFIVMELLHGSSLYDHRPDSLAELVAIMQQVCNGLEHAHAHGIIHRDLKLENVIVDRVSTARPAGEPTPTEEAREELVAAPMGLRVHLTDFGLARSMASRISGEGAVVGTVFYLAPEQALGSEIDSRADLYALGVMLYELAAGRLPFIADDPLAVIAQHLHAPVVPPSTYSSGIPPALEALIIRLLGKDPADRPASAAEVRRTLDDLAEALQGTKTATELLAEPAAAELSALDRLARGRLVGRERELAQARALWKQAITAPDDTHVLLITGEPGVGKTPLVYAIIALAGVSKGRVLRAECYPEGGAPYAPIAQIIQDALPRAGPTANAGGPDLPDSVLTDLLIFPEAEDPGTRAVSNPQAEQQRLYESVVALCATLAATSPLLLVVEDIHWADAGTISLLRHLARRSRSARLPLLIVLTYRETEIDLAPYLNDFLLDLNRERLATRIRLGRYDREQTREILEVMFGQELPREFVERIYHETEGNLFFIEETCKALIEAGEVYQADGSWHWKTGMAEMMLPQSVRGTILARVARLPEPAQETLRLAAIIGREFDFGTLQRASEHEEEALIGALELAERAQLVAEVHKPADRGRDTYPAGGGNGRETFAFAHALIPAALRASVSGLRRRRLHRRVAAAIKELRPDDDAALAYHYGEAGEETLARDYYIRAGDRAAKVYANEDAVRFYTEALELLPGKDPEEPGLLDSSKHQRFDLLAARARINGIMSHRKEQFADAEAMLALAESLDDDARRCDALLTLADVYLATEYARAAEPARRAVELAEALDDPVREAQALSRLAWISWHLRDIRESRRILETAVQLFRGAGHLAEAAGCLHHLSLVLGSQGLGDPEASTRVVQEAIALSRETGDRFQEATGLRRLAIVLLDQMRYDEARGYAEKALALHRETGEREAECHALNVLGMIEAWRGRPEEGTRYLRASFELALEIGSLPGMINAVANLLWEQYRREGDYEGALTFVQAQASCPLLAADPLVEGQLAGERAKLLATLGQFEPALALLEGAFTSAQRWASPAVRAEMLGLLARLHAELGQFDRARDRLQRGLDLMHMPSIELPLEFAGLLVAQGYIALLEGGEVVRSNEPSRSAAILRVGLAGVQQAIELITSRAGNEPQFQIVGARNMAGALYVALGETEEALTQTARALAEADKCPYPPEMERLYYARSRALGMAGRTSEADAFLRRAYDRVMAVAAKTKDEALRRSWLENVRVNRRIVEAQEGRGDTAR